MRSFISRTTLALILFFMTKSGTAQSCFSSGLNGTVINLPCNVNCTQLKLKVPHLKSSSDYILTSIPYTPYPYLSPTGNNLTDLYTVDDRFINSPITLPFPFCFYDSTYTKAVIGSNGILTFDESTANQANSFPITFPIPYAGGTPNAAGSAYYPPASIMGVFSDLDPRILASGSPSDRQIQWRLEGTAPCRRMIVSYYRVGVFGSSCGVTTPTTFQIVIYESTGAIDVFIEQKACFPTTNGGNAILGIQNWQRNKAVAAPGKNATNWLDNNSGYKFVPSGNQSRFIRAELYDLAGTLLHTTTTADTATTTPGLLDINFPNNLCPTAPSTQYVVKTIFASCSDVSTQLVSTDTVTVNKTTSLTATASATAAACGPNGSIAVTIPAGAGAPPYSITLDSGTPVVTSNQNHTFTGVTAGPHNITITTAGGCSQIIPVTVASSGTLTLSHVVTPTSCNGAANGAITINPQNGTAPFLFSLNAGPIQTSNVFSNLAPGTYTIRVADNSGCVLNNYQVTVTTGTTIPAQVVTMPPSCPGVNNGSISITPNGTPPYQYNINAGPFQTSNTFTNLAPGTYFVSVRDNLNCTTGNMTVIIPASTGSLGVTLTTTPTSCTGATNGTISIAPQSGSGPYQYSINNGTTWVTATSITNLPAGNYTVIVRDASGCQSAPQTVTVAAGSALQATVTANDASCASANNGTILVTPNNGALPYTFILDGGTPQASGTFTGVSAGPHTVSFSDAAGCSSGPIPITVNLAAPVTGTAATLATSCNGASNGSATITPANGVAPYQYALNGGAFQSSATFVNLAAGSYTVVIRDNVGCSSQPITFTIAAGPSLTGTASAQPTTCAGATNGTVTATPTNGAAPYTYSIDGGAFQPGATFTGVAAGSHNVVIMDAAGCVTASIPVNVAAGPQATATVSTTTTSCSGANNGTLTVTPVIPGTYQYSIDGGTTFQASPTFTGLAAQTYTVTFTNSLGCTGTIQGTVAAGLPLTATVAPVAVTCNGGNNGSATVTVAGNATNLSYSLDGVSFQASNIFTGLSAGNYTVYFQDNNSCAGQQTFTITQPSAINASVTKQAVTCNGLANGVLTVTASGGTGPYQYSVNSGAYQSSNIFNLPAGSYTITIRDANNCTFNLPAETITEPAVLSATSATTAASCAGGADGTITITATGGTAPYQYGLNGGAYGASNTFNVVSGNYSVTVRDANNCSFTVSGIAVNLNNNLTLTPASDETVCESKGVQISPNTNATSFSWTPAAGLSSTTIKSPVATPAVTTDYIVTATLGNCSANDTIRVVVLPAPVANAGVGDTICFGQSAVLNGSGGVSFDWSPVTTITGGNGTSSITVQPTKSTQYSLHVTDANGCHSLQPSTVNVVVTPPYNVFTNPPDTVAYIGDTIRLDANSIGITYTWSPATGLSNPNIKNPVLTVTQSEIYTVTATTAAGCQGTTTFKIQVFEGPEIYVPNAFTPNRDGKNDFLRPFPVGIQTLRYFKVFNRWGQEVYSWNGNSRGPEVYNLQMRTDIGWNGMINGAPQPTQTYVWIVEGVTKEGKVITKKGTSVLIR